MRDKKWNDPKIEIMSLHQLWWELNEHFGKWFDENEDLTGIVDPAVWTYNAHQNRLWKNNPSLKKRKYDPNLCRIHFTRTHLMVIQFHSYRDARTRKEKIVLGYIHIAARDGVTEYGKQWANFRDFLPEFSSDSIPKETCSFETFILHDLYKTSFQKLQGKYVVLDLETNGLRPKNDDLLSLTVYDPDTGRAYDRKLPLEHQPVVLTKWIHGLGEKDVKQYEAITQKEFNQLISDFDLENKTILVYSKFDYDVLYNYCQRHKIKGFEKLNFFDIKYCFDFLSWRVEKSKDNLCKLFGIEGVTDTHSSLNDCILEWKLFERYHATNWVIIEDGSKCSLCEYCKGYIVPVTYLNDRFIKVANLEIPPIEHSLKKVFDLVIGGNQIKKFDTNINGMAFEHMLNYAIGTTPQDNSEFLIKNNEKLKFINELYNENIRQISVIPVEDGTFKTDETEFGELVEEVNSTYKAIEKKYKKLFTFIKQDIFEGKDVLSQELVITDNKILAKCDMSTEKAVLEIKTGSVFDNEDKTKLKDYVARQIYYQKRDRITYLLSLQFVLTQMGTVKNLLVEIYKVNFL